MKSINLNFNQYLELEKLGKGVFYPVSDFMKKNDFYSVINKMKYKKKIFPLPIILDISEDVKKKIFNRKQINLTYQSRVVGQISNLEIYKCDKKKTSKKIFGTSNKKHPGVKDFLNKGKWFIGGKTRLKKNISNNLSKYEIFPQQSKKIIKKNRFKTIVGFQTRNVPHKAHEYLIRNSLENYDGILIQPLIGQKKIGDYTPESIMKSYNKFIKS